MTSYCMTSLHVDLNEAAKCVDYITHIASLLIAPSHTRTKYKVATIFGLTYTKIDRSIYESLRHQNLEETHDWCTAVGKVAF